MIGGIKTPPVEAHASMPAAYSLENPVLRMAGMVITPVVTTLDTALPEMEPNSAEPTTAIFALPPRDRPVAANAKSVKKAPPPAANNN